VKQFTHGQEAESKEKSWRLKFPIIHHKDKTKEKVFGVQVA
jgi:hypothetical protein